jgi:hypothetical protein
LISHNYVANYVAVLVVLHQNILNFDEFGQFFLIVPS